MLLERQDGTEIKPGEDVGPRTVQLPRLGKRQTVFTYFAALTMEQAIALAVVAKVKGTTPEGFVKTVLATRAITVYPDADAPDPRQQQPAIGPDHPMPYSMAPGADENVRISSIAEAEPADATVLTGEGAP